MFVAIAGHGGTIVSRVVTGIFRENIVISAKHYQIFPNLIQSTVVLATNRKATSKEEVLADLTTFKTILVMKAGFVRAGSELMVPQHGKV